ncbi:ISNCY family transposase [Dolichospermum sp. ST_sed1]|nr:ISNCY family transposase [Dolichospermum sp. ST_sed1]
MVNHLQSLAGKFPDKRTGKNRNYSIGDAVIGAFSVFFTQSPSFLSFQKTMEQNKGKSNAQTLFGMERIPCDNHIRGLLDVVNPSHVFSMFPFILNGMNEGGYLERFRSINNNLLIALDGTQYFSSNTIHCENCSITKHRNGTITYSHSAVTPVIVGIGIDKVIALEPEFMTPQDGHKKQDCENTAGKRWIVKYGPQYNGLKVTILGDDLYSKQSICEITIEEGFNFIFVSKPDSHKTMYEIIEGAEGIKTLIIRRWTGKRREIDTYRFINQIPLCDAAKALEVNWCEITTILEDETVIYKNSFVTNHEITEENVIEIVMAGRARWKIENENNNILKNKGYNLEHNFGHGKKYLSSLLLTFNLLAFLFHTALDMFDKKYKMLRKKLPSRKTFFDDIRALTRYICFDSWENLLNFMIRGLELKHSDSS